MKLLKILTIMLFSIFLFFSVSIAQEKNTVDSGVKNQQLDGNSGGVAGTEIEKTLLKDPTPVVDTEVSDSAAKTKPSVNENKVEIQKNSIKKTVDKKNTPVTVEVKPVEVKEESRDQVKIEGELLSIDEGNFKYRRIPDIKLVDIKPETLDSGNQTAEIPVAQKNTATGFLGLGKTASDVIVKGGVLLLLLLIFVIYKSRMSAPKNKSSKKRNVLNSYRK